MQFLYSCIWFGSCRCLADSVCRPWMFCTPRCPKDDLACQQLACKECRGLLFKLPFSSLILHPSYWLMTINQNMYYHENGSGQRPGRGSSCIMTVGIDWGSGVVISTSRRTRVLLRLTSSVSAVSQSTIVCPSKSWPVRSLAMWNVPGRWNSRRWPAHGMWLVAGIPCSIALTAKCITLACKQEPSPSWEICGDLDVYRISEHTNFFSYHLRTPQVAQMVFWLQHKQIGQSVYQDK